MWRAWSVRDSWGSRSPCTRRYGWACAWPSRSVRRTQPVIICLYGLYASLNAEYLLERVADSVIGGECETPLLGLIQALEEGQPGKVEGVHRRSQPAGPFLKRLPFPVPSRGGLAGSCGSTRASSTTASEG